MSDIAKQLEEIRIKKSIEYNKKLEEQELKEQKTSGEFVKKFTKKATSSRKKFTPGLN